MNAHTTPRCCCCCSKSKAITNHIDNIMEKLAINNVHTANFIDVEKILGSPTKTPRRSLLQLFIYFAILGTTLWVIHVGTSSARKQCLVTLPQSIAVHLQKPILDCKYCRKAQSIKTFQAINMSYEDLLTGYPFVIADAMGNWSASAIFSYDYFRSLFTNQSLHHVAQCQFFPYKTNFKNVKNFFLNLARESTVNFNKTAPWYVGWSNCDPLTADELRRHYKLPYFIPETSESGATDWIFIGTPGYGAPMHVDNVVYPSWQAQVQGSKLWNLKPAPECLYECGFSTQHVLVHSGNLCTA